MEEQFYANNPIQNFGQSTGQYSGYPSQGYGGQSFGQSDGVSADGGYQGSELQQLESQQLRAGDRGFDNYTQGDINARVADAYKRATDVSPYQNEMNTLQDQMASQLAVQKDQDARAGKMVGAMQGSDYLNSYAAVKDNDIIQHGLGLNGGTNAHTGFSGGNQDYAALQGAMGMGLPVSSGLQNLAHFSDANWDAGQAGMAPGFKYQGWMQTGNKGSGEQIGGNNTAGSVDGGGYSDAQNWAFLNRNNHPSAFSGSTVGGQNGYQGLNQQDLQNRLSWDNQPSKPWYQGRAQGPDGTWNNNNGGFANDYFEQKSPIDGLTNQQREYNRLNKTDYYQNPATIPNDPWAGDRARAQSMTSSIYSPAFGQATGAPGKLSTSGGGDIFDTGMSAGGESAGGTHGNYRSPFSSYEAGQIEAQMGYDRNKPTGGWAVNRGGRF